jgi:hypothetical protein
VFDYRKESNTSLVRRFGAPVEASARSLCSLQTVSPQRGAARHLRDRVDAPAAGQAPHDLDPTTAEIWKSCRMRNSTRVAGSPVRFLILSDIHGNREALEAVLASAG